MSQRLAKTLIVLAGPRTEYDRPSTCFSFSHPHDRLPAETRDEFDQDEGAEVVRMRRLQ